MRNKASGLLKQIITALTTTANAKTMAIKSKTKAIKTRLVIFSLLQNRKLLMSSFSDKLNALMGQNNGKISKELEEDDVSGDQQSQSIFLHNSSNAMWVPSTQQTKYEEDDDDDGVELEEKYPDLTHSLFDSEEMEMIDPGASVIEIVKNSKEDKGEEFRLEDEIDRVADLFIKRFHRQMRMQKQLSLKRRQQMLGTSP
ncbi:P-loop containing nucleoside triphosphate hydrolases superfamily protein isoform 1 [Hibiscus syriacus]|uniref:P-loop containing nucleoside triphosphate hydrolases superfamily protein isoform 1 n=1 Tax=Hibiscus syriacus TaxID=106335 RepID=A0A6A3ARN0_HIBSY|nr:uncharacterized protein LOC120122156 [Hibiscus syriacus]KAE8707254.1 P-loop containing nucleoside triphosphate hydrolases superfamily protein isoform 1 [Hibiscus syriacus]